MQYQPTRKLRINANRIQFDFYRAEAGIKQNICSTFAKMLEGRTQPDLLTRCGNLGVNFDPKTGKNTLINFLAFCFGEKIGLGETLDRCEALNQQLAELIPVVA